MSQKILVAAIALMVTRDAMTILPATVPVYELPIMKAVHGDENVRELEEKAGHVELEGAVEADRLEAKYGRDMLEKAYGANFKSAIANAVKEATVVAASADESSGTSGGGHSGDTAPVDLLAMTKAQLLAEADKRGVKADATMNKAQIVEAIETANLG